MKILLVDDHPMVRLGVSHLLRDELDGLLVREAVDGEQALARVQEEIPNLVIMDMGLPGISGLETTRRLRKRLPQLRILFYSMHGELMLVRQALDAGALGYVTKASGLDVLLDAVRRTLNGHPYIEQRLATQLACAPHGEGPGDPRLRSMTQRELEVFVMLARGMPSRLIADHLCLSGKTVSNYLTLLKNKLQVSSHAELVHLAIDTGVLRLGEQ